MSRKPRPHSQRHEKKAPFDAMASFASFHENQVMQGIANIGTLPHDTQFSVAFQLDTRALAAYLNSDGKKQIEQVTDKLVRELPKAPRWISRQWRNNFTELHYTYPPECVSQREVWTAALDNAISAKKIPLSPPRK